MVAGGTWTDSKIPHLCLHIPQHVAGCQGRTPGAVLGLHPQIHHMALFQGINCIC